MYEIIFVLGRSQHLLLLKELLLPTGLWINFLMLPFQNKHSVLNRGSRVRMRAETERDGGGAGWKSPPGRTVESQHGAPLSTQSSPCVR